MQLIEGIWLPDGDTHFQKHLELGPKFAEAGTYQMRKIETALNIVKGWDLAVDIGAHVGLWSRVLAPKFEQVVAFEPMPHLTACFKRNLENHENVVLMPYAVGEVTDVLRLTRSEENSGNCRVALPSEESHFTAMSRRIDDCSLYGVNFLKIDVEGWELPVVRGAERTIRESKPIIVVEQKPGHGARYAQTDDAAVQLLLSWGAKIRWIKAGDYCLGW